MVSLSPGNSYCGGAARTWGRRVARRLCRKRPDRSRCSQNLPFTIIISIFNHYISLLLLLFLCQTDQDNRKAKIFIKTFLPNMLLYYFHFHCCCFHYVHIAYKSRWLTVLQFAKDSKLFTRVSESISSMQISADKEGWKDCVTRAPFLLLKSWKITKKEYWMKRLISDLQVNLPAGKDGDRYNVPWRRKLMIFWEAFHLSLRLQKTKLLFPTIKDTGKVDVERMQQIRKRSW